MALLIFRSPVPHWAKRVAGDVWVQNRCATLRVVLPRRARLGESWNRESCNAWASLMWAGNCLVSMMMAFIRFAQGSATGKSKKLITFPGLFKTKPATRGVLARPVGESCDVWATGWRAFAAIRSKRRGFVLGVRHGFGFKMAGAGDGDAEGDTACRRPGARGPTINPCEIFESDRLGDRHRRAHPGGLGGIGWDFDT